MALTGCQGGGQPGTVDDTATAAEPPPTDTAAATLTPTATPQPEYVRFRGIPLASDLHVVPPAPSTMLDCRDRVWLASAREIRDAIAELPSSFAECFSTASLSASRTFYEQVLATEGWTVEPATRINVEQWSIAATRSQGLEMVYVIGTRYEDDPVVWIISTAEAN
jgi:hypothetical protein